MALAAASVAVASLVFSVNLVKMAGGMGMWGCPATLGGASGGHPGPGCLQLALYKAHRFCHDFHLSFFCSLALPTSQPLGAPRPLHCLASVIASKGHGMYR